MQVPKRMTTQWMDDDLKAVIVQELKKGEKEEEEEEQAERIYKSTDHWLNGNAGVKEDHDTWCLRS